MFFLKVLYLLYAYVAIIPYRFIAQFLGKRFAWRTQITDRIYLGGFYFFPWDFLYPRKNKITMILNLCAEFPTHALLLRCLGVKYFYIPTRDKSGVNRESYKKFLEYFQKSNEKVLVNCAMGQSRSASVVWKLLIDCYHYTPEDAENFLKEKRHISLSKKQKESLIEYFIRGIWTKDDQPEVLENMQRCNLKDSWFYGRKFERITDLSFMKTEVDEVFKPKLCARIADEFYFIDDSGNDIIINTFDLDVSSERILIWPLVLGDDKEKKNIKLEKQYPFLDKQNFIKLYTTKEKLFFITIYHSGDLPLGPDAEWSGSYYEGVVFPLEQKEQPTEEQIMKIVGENIDWVMGKEGAKKHFKGNVYAYNEMMH